MKYGGIKSLSKDSSHHCKINKIRHLIEVARLECALSILKRIPSNCKGSHKHQVLYYQARIFLLRNQFNLALEKLRELKRLDTYSTTDTEFQIRVELQIARSLLNLHFLDDANHLLVSILEKTMNTSNLSESQRQALLATCFSRLGHISLKRGELTKAENLFEKGIERARSIPDQSLEGIILYFMGVLELRRSNLIGAEKKLEIAYKLYKQTGKKVDLPAIAYNLGIVKNRVGLYSQAAILFQEGLEISQLMKNHSNVAFLINSLGSIDLIQGRLDDALDKYYRATQEIERTDQKFLRYHFYYNIALVYNEKNAFDEALAWYHQALRVVKKNPEPHDYQTISLIRYSLAFLFIERGEHEKASNELQKLLVLSDKVKEPIVLMRSQLIQAVLLKYSKDLKDKAKAYEILERITASPRADYTTQQVAIVQLCELLLFEARSLHNTKSLEKLKYWAKKLRALGEQKKNAWSLLAALRFEAKLNAFYGEFSKSIEKLRYAISYADTREMFHWAALISGDLDAVLLSHPKLNTEIDRKNAGAVQEWEKLSAIESVLTTTTPPRQYLTSEKPRYFLVIIPFEEKTAIITISTKARKINNATVAKVLQIFDKKPTLDNFLGFHLEAIDDSMVLIDHKDGVYYTYMYAGNSYLASQKLDFLTQLFHTENHSLLLDVVYGRQNISLLRIKIEEMFEHFLSIYQENNEDEQRPELDIKLFFDSAIDARNRRRRKNKSSGEMLENSDYSGFELKDFIGKRKLLHPVRLTILRFLYKNFKLNASELRALLGIPWGNFATHYTVLAKEELIEMRTEFINTQPRTIFYITDKGLQEFEKIIAILKKTIL